MLVHNGSFYDFFLRHFSLFALIKKKYINQVVKQVIFSLFFGPFFGKQQKWTGKSKCSSTSWLTRICFFSNITTNTTVQKIYILLFLAFKASLLYLYGLDFHDLNIDIAKLGMKYQISKSKRDISSNYINFMKVNSVQFMNRDDAYYYFALIGACHGGRFSEKSSKKI